jgi:putative lipoic acid-binding regulatory protein
MESHQQLRAELEDAIANVQRQIDIDQTTPRGRGSGVGLYDGMDVAIMTLRNTLAELEEALANLDSDDP